jgi:hypothetical protein
MKRRRPAKLSAVSGAAHSLLDYAKVNMAAAGKRWICTEEEAEAAGWRPAKR